MTAKNTNASEPEWGLFYRESKKDLDARKSIKVKLPIRQHIRLHAMKLFSENNISETVEQALDEYFSRLKEEEEAVRAGEIGGPETAVQAGTDTVDAPVEGAVGSTETGVNR